ncbi:hypothetical protein JM654_06930 [Microbacterium oxydans]|nr:hypothetical protein [Microbacterium oxydans]
MGSVGDGARRYLGGIAAGRPRRTSSLAVAVATVFAMGFGLLVPDLQLLILLTYLLAILSPLLLVTFAAAALVRHPVHLIACVGVVVAVVLLLGEWSMGNMWER